MQALGVTMAQPMQKRLPTMDQGEHDIEVIEALIARQLASLSWDPGGRPDGAAFAADFLQSASLYPAARPAHAQTVPAFIDRMSDLSQTSLRSFRETVLG